MLLRSSSTPILSSRLLTKDYSHLSSPEHDLFHHKPRTARSSGARSLTASPSSVNMVRVPSESDLTRSRKKAPFSESYSPSKVAASVKEKKNKGLVEVVPGGGGGSYGGGSGGAGWGDGMLGGGGDANNGRGSTEAYYQKMIENNPGNALILSNYARYLKEVRGDLNKAEEYCGRAILANPNDANILSMYGDIVWQRERDASRADTYFSQAVKAAPDNSYVMASYAQFLWDAEEEEEDDDDDEMLKKGMADSSPASFFQVEPPHGLIAAPS